MFDSRMKIITDNDQGRQFRRAVVQKPLLLVPNVNDAH